MSQEIVLNGQKIKYRIKKYKGAKHLRLKIRNDGQLIATKPWYASDKAVINFMQNKSAWIIEKLNYLKELSQNQPLRNDEADYLLYKKPAHNLILKKIDYFNQAYQFKVGKISVRKQKTRWGSCSAQGNLNFNYKILLLPAEMADYIIVHELCHLQELNHSPRFWQLVAQEIPNYKQIKKDLQKKGIELR
jgi:predicted metal-dependent hydrolase